MTMDNRIDNLKRQLRHQAETLSHRHCQDIPVVDLLDKYSLRVRRRRSATVFCSFVALVASLYLFEFSSSRPPAEHRSATDAPQMAAVRQGSTGGNVESIENGRLHIPPQSWQTADATMTDSVPFMIIERVGGQRRVIATGLYVPEHIQQVNLSDLDPAEQRAVRKVLGFEGEFDSNGPI